MIPREDCTDCEDQELCAVHAPCDECGHEAGLAIDLMAGYTQGTYPAPDLSGATCWGQFRCSACVDDQVAVEAPSLEMGL